MCSSDLAVSDQDGQVQFTRGNDQTGRIAIEPAVSSVLVAACRLDAVLAERSFAMGKIDIEGYELRALQGAQQLLKAANPPVWQLECVGRLLRPLGLRPADLEQWLAAHGYALAVYDADRRELMKSTAPWRLRKNILALHAPAWPTVEARLRH